MLRDLSAVSPFCGYDWLLLGNSGLEITAFMSRAQTLVLELEQCYFSFQPWIIMALAVYLNLDS